jgi:hypothetical protein
MRVEEVNGSQESEENDQASEEGKKPDATKPLVVSKMKPW